MPASLSAGAHRSTLSAMSTFLWIVLATLYLVLLWSFAITCFRNGHYVLFAIGIVFPVLWIVGALIAPRSEAGAAGAT
jgi:hypothetical protein